MATSTVVQGLKDKVWDLIQRRPFQTFEIVMESGDILAVEHPENFAMWPGPETNAFHVFSAGGRGIYSHFEKITTVNFVDPVEA